MKTFYSLKEMQEYYNEYNNTYEFCDGEAYDDNYFDVKFDFHLKVDASIRAEDIKAYDIDAYNIYANDITSYEIKARTLKANDVLAENVDVDDMRVASIKANHINARSIVYYAVCYAYRYIKCATIKGIHKNAKHFCLDGNVDIIEPKKKIEIKGKTIELSEDEIKELKRQVLEI